MEPFVSFVPVKGRKFRTTDVALIPNDVFLACILNNTSKCYVSMLFVILVPVETCAGSVWLQSEQADSPFTVFG